MRKLINSTYVSLDGVVDHLEAWPRIDDRGEQGDQIQLDLLQRCDALVMGRRTYEGFAPAWSARSGDPFSDKINSMPKYVVSSTLTDTDWENTSVLAGDPVEEILRLKEAPGETIVQYEPLRTDRRDAVAERRRGSDLQRGGLDRDRPARAACRRVGGVLGLNGAGESALLRIMAGSTLELDHERSTQLSAAAASRSPSASCRRASCT